MLAVPTKIGIKNAKRGLFPHMGMHLQCNLLEMGTDIITLKELLGHEDINTTLIYLHVARVGRRAAFSPLEQLYENRQG